MRVGDAKGLFARMKKGHLCDKRQWPCDTCEAADVLKQRIAELEAEVARLQAMCEGNECPVERELAGSRDAQEKTGARLRAVREWAMRTHRGAAAQEIIAILDRKETP